MYRVSRPSLSTLRPGLLCCLHVYAQGSALDQIDPYAVYAEAHALGLRIWVPECYLPMIYLLDLDFVRRRDQDIIE